MQHHEKYNYLSFSGLLFMAVKIYPGYFIFSPAGFG